MPRKAAIWFRKSRQAWYTTRGYRKIMLGKTHAEAVRAFHRLMAGIEDQGDGLTVRDVANMRLEFLQHNRAKRTYYDAARILAMFVGAMKPGMLAADLRPADVSRWIDGKPEWGPTYKHKVISTIQQAFSGVVGDGMLSTSPIAKIRKPTPKTGLCVLTGEQVQQVIGACLDAGFRDLVRFMAATGCRPDEARRIESRHLNRRDKIVVFPAAEAKGRERPRVIVPTAEAWSILERRDCGDGCVFRNSDGEPWTANALILRFARISRRLGFPVTAKAFRHTFITDALARGVDCVTVAKLVGHTSPAMMAKVYGHLFERIDYLRSQAERAANDDK